MLYTGIDIHKHSSVASTQDAGGVIVREARSVHADDPAFVRYFSQLPEPSEVLIEACWNWGTLYDLLERTPGVAAVQLSHPGKNRIIADAQIKTDKVDGRALATLLRGKFFSRVHVPSRAVRARKNVIRQRLWLVRMRTMLRNRIHALLDRHPQLERPQFKDVFCKQGLAWMKRVPMPEPDGPLLRDDLALLESLNEPVRRLEKDITQENAQNPVAQRLISLPGVGQVLGNGMALEIDDIGRFPTSSRFSAYCGLVPSTHSSGGKTHHGRMLRWSNRWLKWAFIEAAWVAIGCSDYFGTHYRHLRQRGKGTNVSVSCVAHRMAQIAWQRLRENRDYQESPPPRQTTSPAAPLKN